MKDVEDYVGGIGNQTVLRNALWKNDTKYWQLTSNAQNTQVTYKGAIHLVLLLQAMRAICIKEHRTII